MKNNQSGFSLLEAIIAIMLMTISVVGVVSIFAYAANYNKNNSSRTEALTIAQKKVEELRAARFSTAVTDSGLAGGTYANQTVTGSSGKQYVLSLSIDDNPFTNTIDTNATTKIKQININVRPVGANQWMGAAQTNLVTRRARTN
jgi:type II secretory pathway pseudopilin PulG